MWWILVPLVIGPLERPADIQAFRLAVNPAFSMSPGAFRAVVMVEPNAHNRRLVLRADSTHYYRNSTMQLHGAAAPRRHMMLFENLPPGNYVIEAVLERNDGRRLTRDRIVEVKGMPGR